MKIRQKTVKYSPVQKLMDGLITILAGAHGLSEINTRLRSDPALQRAFGRTGCAEQSVALISSLPGLVLAYPLGGIKWQEMRARAEKELGARFDVRAFHQMLLEDGMLPFAALDAKLDRWIASQ